MNGKHYNQKEELAFFLKVLGIICILHCCYSGVGSSI